MNNTALNVSNVTKTFVDRKAFNLNRLWGRPAKTVTAVEGLSLRIERGGVVGLLGPNGSGKSTLVRLVATLLIPNSGSIEVFGHDVQREELTVKTLINRVSVEASFFKKLSPMENLLYAARLYGVRGKEIKQRGREILMELGLEEARLYQPMEKMSRGMQQKVAIARGFLTSPILILLDEPTTGLDPRSKRQVQAFIRELRTEHDATILLTTHDMTEADVLCDRVAIIDSGRVIARGTPSELKEGVVDPEGDKPTLEDVFIQLTGETLQEKEMEMGSNEL
ncbi:MAG: ABC transporter ATP-binding protein [Candidatus Bipolaricaulota bacterium]